MKKLAVIIPVLNERDSLRDLVAQLCQVVDQQQWDSQLILVDDGSTDGSWDLIQSLAKENPRVRGIRMRRNFGKAAALMAGIEAADAEIIATIDADLQDEPSELPKLVAMLQSGYGVVSGWKQHRQDPWHKVFPSRFFNGMTNWLTGVKLHDHNCGFKVYQREVFDEVKLYGEMHRFVPVLAAARGWRVTEVPVTHHPRRFGKSKYGVSRFSKGFLDLLTVYFLTSFRQRPQHLIGTVGLACLGFGGVSLAYLTFCWLETRLLPGMTPVDLHKRALFYYAILGILLGVQLLSIGFLAELIIAANRPTIPSYSIAEWTHDPASLSSQHQAIANASPAPHQEGD